MDKVDKSIVSFDELAEYLFQYQLSYRSFFKNLFKSSTLPTAQYQILNILQEHKQMRMNEISTAMSISRPNLTPLIDKLVKSKSVKRVTDKHDRRVIYIVLTQKGSDILAAEKQSFSQHCAEVFANFSPNDFQRFSSALSALADLSKIMH